MFLTDEEEKMLRGDQGPEVQRMMEILVTLGDAFDAERLIPVANVHMPGSSVLVTGDAGLHFVEEISRKEVRFRTYTTLNPAAVDLAHWKSHGVPDKIAKDQLMLTDAYRRMGAICSHTCTPYLVGNIPRIGENIAWGESSAIVFANSVLGARTNREGGPSALASAITGRTPLYGFHLDENRFAKYRVAVNSALRDITDYGALGYYVGRIVGEQTPAFVGIPSDVTLDQLKMLGAALASSGAVALFHIIGVTPEASTEDIAFGGEPPSEIINFGQEELKGAKESLSKATDEIVDVVCIGCPHASINEIRQIAELLSGRKVSSKLELWICSSISVGSLAERMGYANIIERAGGTIIYDTCPVLGPTQEIVKIRGYKCMATNSAKLAHYCVGRCGLLPRYGSIENCIEAAVSGSWE